MVISQLTTAQRNALALGSKKTIIYNLDTQQQELWNGSAWEIIATLDDIGNAGNPIVTPISTNSTLTFGNLYIATNNITCTLPTAVGNKDKSIVVFRNGIDDVIITPTLSQTINGDVDGITLTEQYASVKLTSDDANWILN